MGSGGVRVPSGTMPAPLRIHVLDGSEEIPGAVPEATSNLVTVFAALGFVIVVGLDHAGRVTMYRQSEWLAAGVAEPGSDR